MSAASSLAAGMKASDASLAVDLIRSREYALEALAALAEGEVEELTVRLRIGAASKHLRISEDEVDDFGFEPLIRKAIQCRIAGLNARLEAIGVRAGV